MGVFENYGKLLMPMFALVLALIARAITPARPGGRGLTSIAKLLIVCILVACIVVFGSAENSTTQFASGVGLMALLYFGLIYAIAEAVVFALWRKEPTDEVDSE